MDGKYNIEIDKDVFEFLQKNAEPFVDTPNTVLRRLLLKNHVAVSADQISASGSPHIGLAPRDKVVRREGLRESIQFVKYLLQKEFGEEFRRKRPYRLMYESDRRLVYFQNFNKENGRLWYRVAANALKELRASRKTSIICLTNPAEKIAYLLPVKDVEERIRSARWDRDYLEINIDHMAKKWIELDWDISGYLKEYKDENSNWHTN